MIGGMLLELSSVTTDSFADSADDFSIAPVSQPGFSLKGDVWRDKRRLLIQYVACAEGFRARESRVTIIEWRVAQQAARNTIRKILPSRNKVSGCRV
jgi:hypothetical protein